MSALRHRLGDALRHIRLAGRHDDRATVERLLPLLRRPKSRPGEVTWRGHRLRYADGPSLYYQLAEIYLQGVYDFETANPTPRILDVGGNMGIAALRFREMHPQASITTFEADPHIAQILQDNLTRAGDHRTAVVAAAAWVRTGEIGFNATGDDSGNIQADLPTKLPCVDILDYFDAPIDFLKLDVEGAEYDLLAHLQNHGALAEVRQMFLELHHWPANPEPPRFQEILATLTAAGFSYRLSAAGVFHPQSEEGDLAQSGNMLTLRAWRR